MNIKKAIHFFNKPQGAAYLFLFPAIATLICFVVIPLVMAVGMSFLNMTIFLNSSKFVGFNNYIQIISDARFWNALKNTVIFLIFEMPLQIILGLLVSVFLSKNTLFRKFLRSSFFLPTVCSLTAVSIVWSFLLDPNIGMLPNYINDLGFGRLQFLRDPGMAMPLVILITVWKNFGMTMVILVAGIQSVPQSYYEASEIDGASSFRQLINITVPLIVPTIGFCVITSTISALQVFDQIYVMTSGGPLYSTETLVMYIYDVGFKSQPFSISYAAAIAVVLSFIIMFIALSFNKYFNSKETVDF